MNKSPKTKFSHYFVALNRPGAGWSYVVKAISEEHAKRQAIRKYRQVPDIIYQVDAGFAAQQVEQSEQERYDNLGATNFLLALQAAGILDDLSERMPNPRMVLAIAAFLELHRRINPHLIKEIRQLIGKPS